MTLGIDIGGTNLSFGLVEDNRVTNGFSVPSFAPGATLEETLEYLAAQIQKLFVPAVKKIGVGVPSVVDVEKGIVYDTQNIPSWTVVPMKAFLEERFHVPVAVNNDANCYALGVYGTYPAGEKPKTLVAITLGTGMGLGIVDGGRLLCGANCGAGELGCLPYRDSILEDFCSKKFFTEAGWKGLDAYKAAEAGDPAALELFNDFGRHLGAALCVVMLAYDPDRVALSGGIANGYPFFQGAMEAYVKEHFPYRKAVERLRIDICTDGNLPVVGAALL